MIGGLVRCIVGLYLGLFKVAFVLLLVLLLASMCSTVVRAGDAPCAGAGKTKCIAPGRHEPLGIGLLPSVPVRPRRIGAGTAPALVVTVPSRKRRGLTIVCPWGCCVIVGRTAPVALAIPLEGNPPICRRLLLY